MLEPNLIHEPMILFPENVCQNNITRFKPDAVIADKT